MRRIVQSLLCLASISACLSATRAQTPAPAPDLKDPAALLAAAQALNGVDKEGMQPWHLKASYELFNDDGKPLAKGVFEEWWAAKDKWKQSYTGDHYTGATYRSPEGFAHEGESTPWPENFIASAIVSPIRDEFPKNFKPTPSTPANSKLPLSCMNVLPTNPDPQMALSPYTYCFDAGTAILRLRKDSYAVAAYSRLGLFQGRQVGMDAAIQVNGQVLAKVHLEELASSPGMAEDVFTPNAPLSFTRTVGKDTPPITPPKLIHSTDPAIPLGLDRHHLEGKVVVRLTVGRNGKVTGVHVLESPNWSLAESALNAVRTYRFEPAQQNGQPVATVVNVVVNFKVRGNR